MRHRPLLVSAALVAVLTVAAACSPPSSGDGDSTARDTAGEGSPAQGTEADPTGTIPDDFPLASQMGGPEDEIPTSRTGTGLRELSICGTTLLRGLAVRDRMIADNSGGESANTRELLVFDRPEGAVGVATWFPDLAGRCTSDVPPGRPDMEINTEVRASPFGPSPAVTLVQTYTFDGKPGDGATVIHVVPVGASLLITSTFGQWTQDELEDGIASTVAPLRETVAAQAMFEDTGESTS